MKLICFFFSYTLWPVESVIRLVSGLCVFCVQCIFGVCAEGHSRPVMEVVSLAIYHVLILFMSRLQIFRHSVGIFRLFLKTLYNIYRANLLCIIMDKFSHQTSCIQICSFFEGLEFSKKIVWDFKVLVFLLGGGPGIRTVLLECISSCIWFVSTTWFVIGIIWITVKDL